MKTSDSEKPARHPWEGPCTPSAAVECKLSHWYDELSDQTPPDRMARNGGSLYRTPEDTSQEEVRLYTVAGSEMEAVNINRVLGTAIRGVLSGAVGDAGIPKRGLN